MNVRIAITKNYKDFNPLAGQKNKANSNPKQTQFRPNQSMSSIGAYLLFYRGQSQLLQRLKTNVFAWIKELYDEI